MLALRSMTAPRAACCATAVASMIAAADGRPGRPAGARGGRHRRRRRAPARGARAVDQRGRPDRRERAGREGHRRPCAADAPLAERRDCVFMGTSVATGTGARRGGRDRHGDRARARSRTCWRRAERHDDAAADAAGARQPDAAGRSASGSSRSIAVLGSRARPAAAGGVHVGGVARGRRRARGAAGDRHDRARDRRPAHGGAARAHPPAAGGRDAGLRDGDLHRQDRHADHRRDDRARAVGRRTTTRCSAAAAACCDAELGDDGRTGTGDPTELALLAAAAERGIDRAAIERERPRRHVNPFDSERKRMSIARADGVLYVKGAVELLSPAVRVGHGGRRRGERRDGRARAARAGASRWAPAPRRRTCALLGLVGIADPPRTEAIEAVAAARAAGIRTVMITGDHPVTAARHRARAGHRAAGRGRRGARARARHARGQAAHRARRGRRAARSWR